MYPYYSCYFQIQSLFIESPEIQALFIESTEIKSLIKIVRTLSTISEAGVSSSHF